MRDPDVQNTPTVRTSSRIDRALGWQHGSAAVTLLGGHPLTGHGVRVASQGDDVVKRLLGRVERLCRGSSHLVEEFRVEPKLPRDFDGRT